MSFTQIWRITEEPSRVAAQGRLRREYLSQRRKTGAPPPLGSCPADGGGFSFGGHRLSSLYRRVSKLALRLTLGFSRPTSASSLRKYSNHNGAAGAVLEGGTQ